MLSLGSNLGDRAANLRGGVEVLSQHVPVVDVSPIYETAPVGRSEQPAYLNLVVRVAADDPELVLAAAHAAEETRGRIRNLRWGPRTLDVDVVTAGPTVSADPRLTLPHPRAHERAFVLVPWLALDPDAELPGHGPVRALLRRIGRNGVRRWPS